MSFKSFKMAYQMFEVLNLTDTLAMINSALSAEKMKIQMRLINIIKCVQM